MIRAASSSVRAIHAGKDEAAALKRSELAIGGIRQRASSCCD